MAVFYPEDTAKYKVHFYGSTDGDYTTYSGINSDDSITPDFAAAQFNKLFALVGKSVSSGTMFRTLTEEAYDE